VSVKVRFKLTSSPSLNSNFKALELQLQRL